MPFAGYSLRNRHFHLFSLLTVLLAILLVGGCSFRMPSLNLWESDESDKLSPRIVEFGEPVPKGGGRYKVGAPYRIKGRRYVPREVDRYDKTGVASWYGKLFHGRRTANGEIYDMEALTAAHPTLPLPSYVRVTNRRNRRSLVVRVNDRGPYARNRIIDLSWAVASLLQMRAAGTAPVRVEYLGRAPLNGDDRYERSILARQPWAGPRVAYARSPGKAIRYRRRAALGAEQTLEQDQALSVASVNLASAPPQRLPPAKKKQDRLPASFKSAKAVEPDDDGGGHVSSNPPGAARKALLKSVDADSVTTAAADAKSDQAAGPFKTYYVEAGTFREKPLADRLASILTEIAPATVEPVAEGDKPSHRIRLGPFTKSATAEAAASRIRNAGLYAARVKEADS